MKTIYSDDHRLQHGAAEFYINKLVPVHEEPARADMILARIREVGLGDIAPPEDFGMAPLLRVHDADYLDFLQIAWAAWTAAGATGDALPCCTPRQDMSTRVPRSIFGQVAYYSFDATAPITNGTWAAAYGSAQVALSAAALVGDGARAAFALCRPPGHHAAASYYGGYCFLNNAAIAGQFLRDRGAARVAILDVDYHHGNGTQSIFYDRDDVFFLSLHGDPDAAYPFFLGYPEETGRGAGAGFTQNYPLPAGTAAPAWFAALDHALARVAAYRPDALVVSLGVDTYEADPLADFRLRSTDYLRLGARLAALGLPTLFVMEGGYNVAAIGVNVVNVLTGFTDAA